MRVGLLGITGGVGGLFAQRALDGGHEVVALARTPSKVTLTHAKLQLVKGDATSAADVAKVASGVDVVVSCVGQPPRARTHIMETTAANILSASPKKLILVSSLGLCGSSPFIRYVLSLIAGSANIQDAEAADRLGGNASCPWVVVRPAGLGDAPGSGRYLATEETGASFSPISRADVATFLLDALTKAEWERKALQLYAA